MELDFEGILHDLAEHQVDESFIIHFLQDTFGWSDTKANEFAGIIIKILTERSDDIASDGGDGDTGGAPNTPQSVEHDSPF